MLFLNFSISATMTARMTATPTTPIRPPTLPCHTIGPGHDRGQRQEHKPVVGVASLDLLMGAAGMGEGGKNQGQVVAVDPGEDAAEIPQRSGVSEGLHNGQYPLLTTG